jgi:hypothetical protein
MSDRRPTVTQVKNAAGVLSRALFAEAQRIRDEQGHNGHIAAQELEHDAIRVGGMAARVEAMRRSSR